MSPALLAGRPGHLWVAEKVMGKSALTISRCTLGGSLW